MYFHFMCQGWQRVRNAMLSRAHTLPMKVTLVKMDEFNYYYY